MKPILVWRFYDAPKAYQALSTHGGDEDWVGFIPDEFGEENPYWMEAGTAFGCCDVEEHKVDGGRVVIGAHA